MPYISKDRRPFYDGIVDLILNGKYDEATGQFDLHFQQVEKEKQDGDFNYMLTTLFKKLNWISGLTYASYMEKSKPIHETIRKMLNCYMNPESYYNYNRAFGMLTCCSRELKRRYGTMAVLPSLFIEKMMNDLGESISKYEDKKIIENGDV